MRTLLKSLSDISSSAEIGKALQDPEELAGDNNVDDCECTDLLTLSVRMEYIYSVASQATSPAPFKYLFNKYPY
jgi:hypothetical protein